MKKAAAKYNPLYGSKVIYDGYVRWGRMGRSAKEIEEIREFQIQRKN